MYNAHVVLHRISGHVPIVLAFGGLALICNYVFFYEGVRCARRDRCIPFLPMATTLWFAHDANYLIDSGKWFGTYHNWFPELFTFGLVVTFTFECIYVVQTLRYGREELAPRLSPAQYRLWVIGAVVLGFVLWIITKVALSDPLYLMTFMLTAVWALGSNAALAARRGPQRGQSVRQWIAFTGMIVTYAIASIAVFGGKFDQVAWIVLCVAGVAGGIGMTLWIARAEAATPASAEPATRMTVARQATV